MKKFLFLLSVLFLVTISLTAQETPASNQLDKQQQLEQQVKDLQTKFDNLEYKTKVDFEQIGNTLGSKVDSYGKSIEHATNSIYFGIGGVSAVLVLLGIFLAIFSYKTNREYTKAISEFKVAEKDLKEAKKLQEGSKVLQEDAQKHCEQAEESVTSTLNKKIGEIDKLYSKVSSDMEELSAENKKKLEKLLVDSESSIAKLFEDKEKMMHILVGKAINRIKEEAKIERERNAILYTLLSLAKQNRYTEVLLKTVDAEISFPKDPVISFYKALAKYMLHKLDDDVELKECISILEDAVSIDNNNPDYYDLRARIYFQLGDKEKGFQDFDKAISLKGNNSQFNYIEFLLLFNNLDLAKDLLGKINTSNSELFEQTSYLILLSYLEAIETGSTGKNFEKLKQFSNECFGWTTIDAKGIINSKRCVLNEDAKKAIGKVLEFVDSRVQQIR